jgi:hypothetical protein
MGDSRQSRGSPDVGSLLENLDYSASTDARLQVLGDYTISSRFQRIRDFPRDWNCSGERNRTALDPVRQRFSWHQFHDEKVALIEPLPVREWRAMLE